MRLHVVRLAVKTLRLAEKTEMRGGAGLEFYMGGGEGFVLETYEASFHGLLVQDPSSGEVSLVPRGSTITIEGMGAPLCRWHTGPLERRDDPLRRRYCLKPAQGSLGYCHEHLSSLRAVYDACFGSSGALSRDACLMLDRALDRRVEYAVYLVDYGGRSLKVGSTRLFRWLDRIAEQPHAAASLIYVTRSAVDARGAERAIASMQGFSEIPARNRLGLSRLASVEEAARRVASASRRLASKGYAWRGVVARVKPPDTLRNARLAGPEELEGRALRLEGYWGGYLLLSGDTGSYALPLRRILHRAAVAV